MIQCTGRSENLSKLHQLDRVKRSEWKYIITIQYLHTRKQYEIQNLVSNYFTSGMKTSILYPVDL